MEDVYWTFSYSPINDDQDQIAGVLVTCIETTQTVLTRNALYQSYGHRSLNNQAPVAIALFRGPDFVIELANERVLTYWDRPLEAVLGKPLFVALPEARGQGFEALLTAVLKTGQPFRARELSVDLWRGGKLEKTYIDLVYQPYYETGPTPVGIIVLANDITPQVVARQEVEEQVVERTRTLTQLTGELRRSNENLQQFAYIASHDLQEPLRKVQQFGDLLRSHYVPEQGAGLDYLTRMQSAASRMSTLIRDLLNFSRLSTQNEPYSLVSLPHLVGEILLDLATNIQEIGAVVILGDLPTIAGEKSQLRQLFSNLLTNALKFSQPGTGVVIRIGAQTIGAAELPPGLIPGQASALYHCIDVSDNGIGFDEKYLDRIFKVFQRLHGKGTYVGTGIGLAICAKIAMNHGGAITARSQVGHGLVFSVYIPLFKGINDGSVMA